MIAAFFMKRRVREALRRTSSTIVDGIGALSTPEKAATLAMANAVLIAVTTDTGLPLTTRPDRLDADVATHLIDRLRTEREKVVLQVRAAGELVAPDVLAQATRQIYAFDLLILTASLSISSDHRGLVVKCWKDLLTAKPAAAKALKALVAFARATGSQPLPPKPGGRWNQREVIALASSPPPFLRPKAAVRAAA